MAKLKPWYDVVELREDLRENRPLDASEFAIHLDQIRDVTEYTLSLTGRATDAGAVARGEEVFVEQCAACHGEGGVGDQEIGAPQLSNEVWLYGGEPHDIMSQITRPRHGVMPAFGTRLDEATIKMLAIYVHSLGGGQ